MLKSCALPASAYLLVDPVTHERDHFRLRGGFDELKAGQGLPYKGGSLLRSARYDSSDTRVAGSTTMCASSAGAFAAREGVGPRLDEAFWGGTRGVPVST